MRIYISIPKTARELSIQVIEWRECWIINLYWLTIVIV